MSELIIQHKHQTKLPSALVFLTILICILPYLLNLLGVDFGISKFAPETLRATGVTPSEFNEGMFKALKGGFVHTLLEWSAFCTAVFTVMLAYTYFAAKKDILTPIIGTALFFAGCMDAFHTLAADRLIDAVADNQDLIPFTWAICRVFNALILITGVSILLHNGGRQNKSMGLIIGTSLLFGLSAYAIIHFCATSNSIPNTMFPDSFVTRPWDIGPLILFLFGGIFVFPKFYKRERNYLAHSILISIIPHVATQMYMAFGSTALFDNNFNIAHFLKIIAYMVPFAGLSLEYIEAYRDEKKVIQSLKLTQNELWTSQEKIKAVVENMVDALITIDQEGRIESFNHSAEKMFGYKATEVTGKNIKMLLPEPYSSEHDGYLERYLFTHQPRIININREIEGLRKNGVIFPIELSISEINVGGVHRFSGIVRDITERKNAEREQSMNYGLVEISAGPHSLNEGMDKIFKIIGDSMGWKMGIFWVRDKTFDALSYRNVWLSPSHQDPVHTKFLSGSIELKFQRGEGLPGIAWEKGKITWMADLAKDLDLNRGPLVENSGFRSGIALPIYSSSGFAGVMEFFSTETFHPDEEIIRSLSNAGFQIGQFVQRKLAESALKKAKNEAEQANKTKSIFLANMGHEIRTPLNAVLGYSQVLSRDKSISDEHRKIIHAIETGGNHLLDLINEILDLSKLESGKMEFEVSEFNLNELMNGLISMFQKRCADKKLELKFNRNIKENVVVHGDKKKLRQVIINLLGNAVKFTGAGVITLQVTQKEDEFLFEVMDTGKGIPEDEKEIIFEPFVQKEAGLKKGGTGLGLAISEKVVDVMGGYLCLESQVDRGSRFYFTLQMKLGKASVPENRSERAFRISHLAVGTSVKALVVDGNEPNRKILSLLLQSIGVEVETAIHGADALGKIHAKEVPDIIFMDARMPVMSGLETIEKIVDEFGRDRIPIVLMTSTMVGQDLDIYYEKGAKEIIYKPFRAEIVFMCIKDLLSIEFEHEETVTNENKRDSSSKLEIEGLSIPADLFSRLNHAVEFGDLTAIRENLVDLEKMSEEAKRLSEHIRDLVNQYNFDEIQNILREVNHES